MNKTLLLLVHLLFFSVVAMSQDTSASEHKVPFDGYDLSWINGQNRQQHFPLELKDKKTGETILTGVALGDMYYNYNFARPIDNTQVASATVGRTSEITVNLVSIGMETNYKNIIGRIWLQAGNMLNIDQEIDGSVVHGRNTTSGDLKIIREAAAGYHFNKLYGINLEAGIFMSYIGLESYLTQENWCYQRATTCDFTPFYFSGARMQIYPSKNVKTEVWLVNGWQSYNSWSRYLGGGSSTYWRPYENLQLVANFYGGADTKDSRVGRFHHDNSVCYRYYHVKGKKGLSQAAFSINDHFGFQAGHGISGLSEYMTGVAIANRLWFYKNIFALTVRADFVTNPGVYLALAPSNVRPNDFTDAIAADPHHRLNIFQGTVCFDIMPVDYVTLRFEYDYRQANVPYFAGHGGTTSPDGYTTTPIPAGWRPDLIKYENRLILAVNFRI